MTLLCLTWSFIEVSDQVCLFDYLVYYHCKEAEHTIVAVATDDMALNSKCSEDAQWFKAKIKRFWDIMDYGPIKWFLGFEIKRDRDARMLAINQRAYIKGMVEKFGMAQAKLVSMPMELGVQFSVDQCLSSANQVTRMHGVPYIQAIGSVLWPVVVSQPDAAYVVGVMLQFMQNPGPAHQEGLKRIINYLGSTKDLWLTFGGQKEMMVEGFCDADWASQKHNLDSCSISVLGRSHGAQRSKELCHCRIQRQSTSRRCMQPRRGSGWGGDLRRRRKTAHHLMQQSRSLLAKDNKFHARTKHINLRYHFICEVVEDGKIQVKYIPMDDNVSNIFTKPLLRPKFTKFVESLGLRRSNSTKAKHRCWSPLEVRTSMWDDGDECREQERHHDDQRIIVSNKNDHRSGDHGCGTLY